MNIAENTRDFSREMNLTKHILNEGLSLLTVAN